MLNPLSELQLQNFAVEQVYCPMSSSRLNTLCSYERNLYSLALLCICDVRPTEPLLLVLLEVRTRLYTLWPKWR